MTRFIIKNTVLPISYKQFSSLTPAFFQCVSDAYQTDCQMTVKAYICPQFRQKFVDPYILEAEKRRNETFVFYQTSGNDVFCEQAFNTAAEIEAIIAPMNEAKAPIAAFACATFKRENHADFYVQGGRLNYSEIENSLRGIFVPEVEKSFIKRLAAKLVA